MYALAYSYPGGYGKGLDVLFVASQRAAENMVESMYEDLCHDVGIDPPEDVGISDLREWFIEEADMTPIEFTIKRVE